MSYQSARAMAQFLESSDAFITNGPIIAPTLSLPPVETLTLDIPAELQYVNTLSACICAFLTNIEQLAEPETTLYNLELAIQEISVNIATHAYANARGRIRMVALLSYQPLRITITLHDTGVSFNPDTVLQPRLGELQEHGYGLFLVTHLMDEVVYQHTDSGNIWTLTKNLPSVARHTTTYSADCDGFVVTTSVVGQARND
jgi:serine/threonine-protein kinase RsbW